MRTFCTWRYFELRLELNFIICTAIRFLAQHSVYSSSFLMRSIPPLLQPSFKDCTAGNCPGFLWTKEINWTSTIRPFHHQTYLFSLYILLHWLPMPYQTTMIFWTTRESEPDVSTIAASNLDTEFLSVNPKSSSNHIEKLEASFTPSH